MQRSAKAKLQIRNLGTVSSDKNDKRTSKTAKLPKTAIQTTSQTLRRNQVEPITSSQGFKASGSG